jgi:hypothetical protein|tara:strand:- start:249 stop:620 length:372 start_codon:yes stop_codon:yes gene_type:complete
MISTAIFALMIAQDDAANAAETVAERALRSRQTEVSMIRDLGPGLVITPTIFDGIEACFLAAAGYAAETAQGSAATFSLSSYSVHVVDEGFQYFLGFRPLDRSSLTFDCAYSLSAGATLVPRP